MSDPQPLLYFPNKTSNIPFVCLLLQLPCQLYRSLRWANFYAASFLQKVCLFCEQLLHRDLIIIYHKSVNCGGFHTAPAYTVINQQGVQIEVSENYTQLAFRNLHFSTLFVLPNESEFQLYSNTNDGFSRTESINLTDFTKKLFNDWLNLEVNVV
jgi:hypothetical protein